MQNFSTIRLIFRGASQKNSRGVASTPLPGRGLKIYPNAIQKSFSTVLATFLPSCPDFAFFYHYEKLLQDCLTLALERVWELRALEGGIFCPLLSRLPEKLETPKLREVGPHKNSFWWISWPWISICKVKWRHQCKFSQFLVKRAGHRFSWPTPDWQIIKLRQIDSIHKH